MTCIIGLREKDRVWVGVDSQVSGGWTKGTLENGTKLIKRGDCLIAGCGYLRDIQLLRHSLELPELKSRTKPDDYAFAVTRAIKALLKENQTAHMKDNIVHGLSSFLLAWGPHLYSIGGDFSYCKVHDKYQCDGSGGFHAEGSLYTTQKLDMSSQERVKMALEAACHHAAGCGPPFSIASTL